MPSVDDLAVMVFEARKELEVLRIQRFAKEQDLAKATSLTAQLRVQEANVHSSYQVTCDSFEAFLLQACTESESVRELDALQNLVLLRLEQDNLTFVNLREQLDRLHGEAHTKIEGLREARQLANEAAAHYANKNAQATREGQQLRERVKSLEKETRVLEANVCATLLLYGRQAFLGQVSR